MDATNEPLNPEVGDLTFQQGMPSQVADLKQGEASSAESLLEGSDELRKFMMVASLANLAHVYQSKDGEWQARGDPTEIALQVFASRFGHNRSKFTDGDEKQYTQVAEYPFDSDVKMMSTIFESEQDEAQVIYTKGAVERVLEKCTSIIWTEEEVELTEQHTEKILENMEELAALGLRVLALASKQHQASTARRGSHANVETREEIEYDLVFRGLVGLYDPPRTESADAVKRCHRAGIKVHMLTGDHAGTARAIAAQVGILPDMSAVSKETASAMVMTAKQFDHLSDKQIDDLPVLPLVIARCAPTRKSG